MTSARTASDAAGQPERRDRRSSRSVSERTSTLRRLAVAWALGLLGLAAVATQDRVPVEDLLLDASVVGGGRWYAGLVTSLAVMGWTVASVSLGFAAATCRMTGRVNASRATGTVAAIVTVLLFDDLFLLHSNVVPVVFGGSKWWLIGLEGAATIAWLVRWRSEIVRTRWELLAAAGFGLFASILLDRWSVGGDELRLIAEDGAKFLGVLALATWAVSTAADLIRAGVAGSSVRLEEATTTPTELVG